MPGSDRLQATKRKAESLYHPLQQAAGGDGKTAPHAGPGKHFLKSTSSASFKLKRSKSKHEAVASACGSAAPPPVGAIKPLVEYDDISSDSDTFLDSPAVAKSADGRDADRVDSDYSRPGVSKDNRAHKHKRSRKKSKDPHRVRESLGGEGNPKRSSKEKDSRKKRSGNLAAASRRPDESGSKRSADALVQSAVNLGSSASSASSSRSKESGRSKSRKDKERREGNEDKTRRKPHKASPKGKGQSRGSPRRKAAAQSASPRRSGGDSPCAVEPDNSYSSRRRVASPSPYREPSRRSRQRSESPYGRRRSSSCEKDGSPYVSRKHSPTSPYGNRRSSSTSPVSR